MKHYKVEVRLGQGVWKYRASYKTLEKAQQVIAFWKGQRGAVNNEPFDARIMEGDNHGILEHTTDAGV